MDKAKKIFLNQRLVSAKDAKVYVGEPSLLYGWGVFETMRSYKNNIVYLCEHIERLRGSALRIGIRCLFGQDKIKDLIKKAIKVNRLEDKDAYLRLNLWKQREKDLLCIIARPYQAYSFKKYKQGMRACISKFRQNENSPLAGIKSTSYLFFNLAYTQAKRGGFDEAIILDSRGHISECSRANIFLVRKNRLLTPSLDCGCLGGITRRVIFDLAQGSGITVEEGRFRIETLYHAQEAFITNSLIGVMPLVSVDNKAIAEGTVGRITGLFMTRYNSLLKNEI